jgi:TRAP-type C4-dicarboxylate transport system permease small subunit
MRRSIRWMWRHAEEAIAGIALVVVVLSVCWGVLTRYVTAQPAAWAGEVAQIAFAWMVFLGAAAGFKYGMHISIDLFVSMLPASLRGLLQWATDLLVLVFLAYVIWLAIVFNQESWTSPTSVLRISSSVIYGSVLVGMAFMAARYAQTIAQRLRGGRLPLFSMPGSAASQTGGGQAK